MEQIWPQDCRLDAAGALWIGGCSAQKLAETFGTPLYVFDEITLRTGARGYKAALTAHYPGTAQVAYASKAYLCTAIAQLFAEEGLDLDVVSGGELYVPHSTFQIPHSTFQIPHSRFHIRCPSGYAWHPASGRIPAATSRPARRIPSSASPSPLGPRNAQWCKCWPHQAWRWSASTATSARRSASRRRWRPRLEPGDLLAVPMAGAYTPAMANNYNLATRPAAVLVKDGQARLIQRRETYADLVARDLPLTSSATANARSVSMPLPGHNRERKRSAFSRYRLHITAATIGNPHCGVFMDDLPFEVSRGRDAGRGSGRLDGAADGRGDVCEPRRGGRRIDESTNDERFADSPFADSPFADSPFADSPTQPASPAPGSGRTRPTPGRLP